MWSVPDEYLAVLRRRPRPWVRFSHAQLDAMLAAGRDELTREKARGRAHHDRLLARLEQAADRHAAQSFHATTPKARAAHRLVADELRKLARDLDDTTTEGTP